MKKKTIIGLLVGLAAVIAGWVLIEGWLFHGGATVLTPATVPEGSSSSASAGITQVTLSRSAYEIALAGASTWHPDAALLKMVLADAASNTWKFTFVSAKNKGKGFEVVVDGQNIVRANEVAISGGGTALPMNVVSPDQAIATARTVPGYGTATITSVEMVYNATAHQWYWGIKTASGTTLTVKATH